MKKPLILLSFLIAFAAPVRAELCKGWHDGDTLLYSMYAVAQTIDVLQTRTFLHHPNFKGQHEANPELGPHPSDEVLYTYNLVRALGTFGIACVLPNPWRDVFLFYQFAVELYAVEHNYRVGVRIRF